MWAKWAEPVQLYVVRNALVAASTTIVVRDDAKEALKTYTILRDVLVARVVPVVVRVRASY